MARKDLFAFAAILVLSTFTAHVCAEPCYYPNGTDANAGDSTPQYTPCSPGSPQSMCCHIYDECRSDGLCLSTWYDNNVWRDFCTDPTWESPACQKLCVNGTGVAYANNPANRADTSVTVTPCNDGSYCCEHGTTAKTCCSNGNGVFLVDGEAMTNPTASPSASQAAKGTKAIGTKASSTSKAAQVTITIPASSPEATTTTNTSSKNSHAGAIAGAVLGSAVALALLTGLAWLSIGRRRTPSTSSEKASGAYYSQLPHNQACSNQAPLAQAHKEYYGGAEAKVNAGNNVQLDGLPCAELPQDISQGRIQLPHDRDGGSGVRHEMGPGS